MNLGRRGLLELPCKNCGKITPHRTASVKESDMPVEKEWERFFCPREALRKLGLRAGMTL